MGDATKARIDDLAAGWSVDSALPEPVAPAAPTAPASMVAPEAAPRDRPRTQPPPPPGSTERKVLEQTILETSDTIDDDAPVRVPRGEMILATSPVPKLAPPVRAQTKTKPPPIPPPRPKTASGSPPPILTTAIDRTPPVIVDASLGTVELLDAAAVATTVPRGEFEGSKPTVQRDAAEALLQIPIATGGTMTSVKTSPFERADPTSEQRDDVTTIQAPSDTRATGGTLRLTAALRRKRGIYGDVRYVFTALMGIRTARREQAELEERQRVRQISRRRHLTTLGRTAVSADAFDHPALGKSRDALQVVEDERSKHAGAVAASDSELERVRHDREVASKQHAAAIAADEAELVSLAKKLEPLEKDAAVSRKKASELADQLRRIAKQITDTEALLTSVKSEKMDRAGIQSDIASLKADQRAIQRDEPAIAAELDALEPRIAAIRAARTEADKHKTEQQAAEAEDQRRTTELFEAIGAKRKVVERAATEAEAARDRVLFELGERLYVDNPRSLAAQLSPIDRIDLELGESDRRVMELREILSNVDRAKIVRGALVIVLVLAATGAFVAWLLYMLL
jgi:hypothetical protein